MKKQIEYSGFKAEVEVLENNHGENNPKGVRYHKVNVIGLNCSYNASYEVNTKDDFTEFLTRVVSDFENNFKPIEPSKFGKELQDLGFK